MNAGRSYPKRAISHLVVLSVPQRPLAKKAESAQGAGSDNVLVFDFLQQCCFDLQLRAEQMSRYTARPGADSILGRLIRTSDEQRVHWRGFETFTGGEGITVPKDDLLKTWSVERNHGFRPRHGQAQYF